MRQSFISDILFYPKPKKPLSNHAFYNGIRRCAQVVYALGLNHHCETCWFMVGHYPKKYGDHWHYIGKFILNKDPEFIGYLDVPCIIDDGDEEQRLEQYDDIKIYYDCANGLEKYDCRKVLILDVISDAPVLVGAMLVTAFAIGIKEVDPKWDFDWLMSDSLYSTALTAAAHLIVLAIKNNLPYASGVDDVSWQNWHRDNPDKLNLTVDVLQDATEHLFPEPD